MCRIRLFDFRKNFVGLTLILTMLVVICSVLAVSVPQWLHVTPQSTLIGLFRTCQGTECEDLSYPVKMGCRNGSDVRSRMESSAGMLIVAAILIAIVAMVVFLDILKCLHMTRYGRFCVFVFAIVGVIAAMTSISITGNTFDTWLYCGTSICDAAFSGSTCGMGFSSIVAIVATIMVAIIMVMYFLDTCRMTVEDFGRDKKPDVHRVTFLYATCFVLMAAAIMFIISLSTPEWYVAHGGRITVGLFNSCVDEDCEKNKYEDQVFTTVSRGSEDCEINMKTVGDRVNAVAAFLFLPMFLSLALFLLFFFKKCGCLKLMFTHNMKLVLVVLMWMCFVSQFVSLVLFTHTFDTYYFCGLSYCAGMQISFNMPSTTRCGKGFSWGLGIVAVVASFFLALMHLFELNDWACFSNRATASDPFGVKGSAIDNAMTGAGSYEQNGTAGKTVDVNRYTEDGKLIPEGDWEHDAVSGYYWSQQKYIFWDPESEQFYNPDTETWSATA